MTRDEFDALKQKVNEQAVEYTQSGKSIRLREQIWLSLWKMRPVLFQAKAIRDYRNFSPSSLYETGEEFLEEVFLESFPQILDSYVGKNVDTSEQFPFMKHFDSCFFRKVYEAYSHIQDKENIFHDHIVVRKSIVQIYREPREDALIQNTFLKQGMMRRILGRILDADGKTNWIKTKTKEHGQTIYVREEDVECCDKGFLLFLDDCKNVEKENSNKIDDQVISSNIYEDYILTLLSLVEQLYARNQSQKSIGLSKQYCFKLLYTEILIDKLKHIYEAIGDVKTAHEQEALSVAEADLMDYLLIDICRTFSAIVKTPLHAYRDFVYLNTDNAEEISMPIANIIYLHFLVDVKGIGRKLNSIAPSLSKYRTEFNRLYFSICERNIINC